MKDSSEEVKIKKVESIEDIEECFNCISLAFGDEKPLLNAIYPNHSTKEGKIKGIKRLEENWLKYKDNEDFHFLKAVLPCGDEKEEELIVGFAIWTVMNSKKNLESSDASKEFDLNFIYPEDQPKQKEWLKQIWKEYIQYRRNVILNENSKTFISFELCAVKPEIQRKGVGRLLSEWGIQFAKQNKIHEAIVEASIPGIGCYKKVGFTHQIPMDFSKVDQDLLEIRPFPRLMFMRTGPLQD